VSDPFAAAVAVARELGLPADGAVGVGGAANVHVHLRPAPVVARVTMTLRRGREALETELAFARAASERGAPVVPPADDRVYEHAGLQVTLWRFTEHRVPEAADAPAVGRALRRLHEAVRDLELPLPRFDRLDEAERVARGLDHPDTPLILDAVHAARERLAKLRLDEQPIHGDAHLRNALVTVDGPLWADLENVCRGPVEYDLACAVWRTRVHGWDGGADVPAGYGPHDAQLVDELLPVLAAFLVPWNARMAPGSQLLRERIDFLRSFA